MVIFANRFITSIILVLLFISYPNAAENTENNKWSEKGGYSVLMEQYTATWCDVCASVDSWMPEYVESNGNRVIRIALHDSVDDPMGTPITNYRLEKYTENLVAPSFWFDGKIISGGSPDTTTLHRSLLSAENERRGDTEINLQISLESDELHITSQLSDLDNNSDSKILFLIIEDNVKITNNTNSNGVKLHHDVLFAYNEIYLSNSSDWMYPVSSWSEIDITGNNVTTKFSFPSTKSLEDMEIVVVHESIKNDTDKKILGATSIHLGNENTNQKINIFVPIMAIIFISAIPIIIQFRR